MSAGIRIINDFGTILIDDQSKVLTLRSTTDQTSRGTTTYDWTAFNSTYPQFFVSDCPTGVIVNPYTFTNADAGWESLANGSYLLRLSVGVNNDGSSAGRLARFRGWVFDEPLNTTPSTYGMKVFNSVGALVFDALQENARVVGVIDGYGSMAVPAGRTYAIGMLSRQHRQDNINLGGSIYGNRVLRSGLYATSTEVGIQEYVVSSFLTSPNPSGTNPTVTYGIPRALVVDVTGY